MFDRVLIMLSLAWCSVIHRRTTLVRTMWASMLADADPKRFKQKEGTWMEIELGWLVEVDDLRATWPKEDKDFTPWLSENLDRLSEAIGIDLELVEPESYVGGFRVDILARDVEDGRTVIIENQLETTDHNHLGQLITYASGKNASLAVWIVKHADEEHRAAVEWLNAHTDEGIGFILCEIKLFRIGDSKIAPMFKVLEQPNDWAKAQKSTTSRGARKSKPKIKDMLAWGVIKEGDVLVAYGTTEEATLLANGRVFVDDAEMSAHDWLKAITGWPSVSTYNYAIHKETQKTLGEIRQEYLEELDE